MKKIILSLIVYVAIFFLISCKKEDHSETSKYYVSTLAGSFNGPIGVAIDNSGNVYVTDNNNRISKISVNGSVNNSFSGSGFYGMMDGPAPTARFWSPWGLVYDGAGTLYVADAGNNSIRKVLADGSVTTLTGGGNGYPGYLDGDITIARFNHPHGIALDASGQLYVTDKDNKKIRKISTGGIVSTVADAYSFSDPLAITVDNSGNIYVGDFHKIRKISAEGQVTEVGEPGSYYAPTGLDIDSQGNLFFIDRVNNSIHKFSSSGQLTRIAGGGTTGGFADGDGNSALFAAPMSLALDAAGNIYVADFGNNRIRKISLQ